MATGGQFLHDIVDDGIIGGGKVTECVEGGFCHMFVGVEQCLYEVGNGPACCRLSKGIGDAGTYATVIVGMQELQQLSVQRVWLTVQHAQHSPGAWTNPGPGEGYKRGARGTMKNFGTDSCHALFCLCTRACQAR